MYLCSSRAGRLRRFDPARRRRRRIICDCSHNRAPSVASNASPNASATCAALIPASKAKCGGRARYLRTREDDDRRDRVLGYGISRKVELVHANTDAPPIAVPEHIVRDEALVGCDREQAVRAIERGSRNVDFEMEICVARFDACEKTFASTHGNARAELDAFQRVDVTAQWKESDGQSI
jgi:hypothetical protein